MGYPALPPMDGDEVEASEDETDHELPNHRHLKDAMKQAGHLQYVGKSSAFLLLQQVLDMKESATVGTGAANIGVQTQTFQHLCGEALRENPVSRLLKIGRAHV